MSDSDAQALAENAISTNARLLSACLAGDRAQIGELLNLYRPFLMAIARGEWRDGMRAKEGVSDLVQETLMKGLQAFDQFQGKTEGEFAGWLRQILLRTIQNSERHYRTERRQIVREEPLADMNLASSDPTPSKEAVTEETRIKLELALSQLPPEYMEVIRLRQFENLSWEEIGTRLDRSAGAAQKLWARAVIELQKNVDLQSHVKPAAKLP